jgi:hypothetical protein
MKIRKNTLDNQRKIKEKSSGGTKVNFLWKKMHYSQIESNLQKPNLFISTKNQSKLCFLEFSQSNSMICIIQRIAMKIRYGPTKDPRGHSRVSCTWRSNYNPAFAVRIIVKAVLKLIPFKLNPSIPDCNTQIECFVQGRDVVNAPLFGSK